MPNTTQPRIDIHQKDMAAYTLSMALKNTWIILSMTMKLIRSSVKRVFFMSSQTISVSTVRIENSALGQIMDAFGYLSAITTYR